jgi:hypothetical protein
VSTAEAKPYSVTVWGSHPDEGNDDCWQGGEYATNEEASAEFMASVHGAAKSIGSSPYAANWQYVMVDGPDVHLIAKNPRYSAKRAAREQRETDAEWRRERAMQAGMAFGCDGYNEEMGW